MENSTDTGKIVGALVIGALVGAALGVLFAPDKGSKTRRKLMGGAQGLSDEIKQQMLNEAEAFRTRAAELESIAEGKAKTAADKLKQNLDVFTNHS